MSSESKILIVGAGPAGLVLALTLLRNGVPVRIIEREPKHQLGQRGRGIQPRILEIYEFLGIATDIIEASGFNPPIHEYPSPQGGDPPKKIIEMTVLREDTPACPHNNPRMLAQDRHEAILREHLLKDYGCEVELGTELRSFKQHPDHIVAHVVKHNDNNEEVIETAKFDWLVGADGAESVVRKQLGLSFNGDLRPPLGIVVGDIQVKSGLDQKAWRIWGDNATVSVALRPFEILNDDRYTLFIRGPKVDLEKVASNREDVVKTLYEISGRHDIEFGELISVGIWRPNVHMANKFSEGRVFITGDAAHVHGPAGGQGINSAILDSFNLGWKLALVSKGLSSASILESYSDESLPVIASMLNMTTASSVKPPSKGGQNAGWSRGYELGLLGVNYRGSALVLDEKNANDVEVDSYRSGLDGGVRGGDRAPDAPELVVVSPDERKTKKLFEIFRPSHHTVLVFSGTDSGDVVGDVVQTLSSYPKGLVKSVLIFPGSGSSLSAPSSDFADLILADFEGYAFKKYNIGEKGVSVVIVRPDGYIGALVGGTSGVKAYFERVFA